VIGEHTLQLKLHIRRLAASDRAEFIAAVKRSKSLHAQWVSPAVTTKAFDRYLEKMSAENACALLVVRRDTGAIVGVVNFTNMIQGALCSCFAGYFAFAPHHGQGFMTMGLKLAVRHAFGQLRMHRVEANIQPENVASIKLARAAGFAREGFSPRYLKIGGRWRDHERWAVLKPA
jgi:[ribosomal protein S5]-alanine N-acetyltransferase